MRSDQKPARARRARRRTLATMTVCAGAAFGIIATTGLAAATPTSTGQDMSPAAATQVMPTVSLSSTISPASVGHGDEAGSEVAATLDGARAAVADATAVTTEIAESGLDLGETDTSIDTTALDVAIDRLSQTDAVPVILFPSLAEDAAAHTQVVGERVAELRGTLEAARAQKEAEEAAAAEAQRQAEEAAAAAAAAAERQAAAPARGTSSSSGGGAAAPAAPAPSGGGGGGAANTPEGAKAVARDMVAARGWGDDQHSCLVTLWQRESGWNYRAYNASSGATGIPQALPGSKMASAGADWATNGATQIAWGLGYISGRYGTPCAALGHSNSVGWY